MEIVSRNCVTAGAGSPGTLNTEPVIRQLNIAAAAAAFADMHSCSPKQSPR
ncbi:hypothetical protein [Bordetella bronchiseptica]|uniref:hypothetical protein n=1 Tax=Bordetella bronchiseptica TaxID=518 RepID=UPI0013771405|nr:hypothetical protein [Bordetella bronchiseptica]